MKTIIDYLSISTEDLKKEIACMDNSISGANFTFISGDSNTPYVLIAHIDTLSRKRVQLRRTNNIIDNSGDILGADDRAGVYAAMAIYNQAKVKPHLLFTDKEEVGGIGAKEVSKFLSCPKGVKLLIELDRKGCNEYVVYDSQHRQVHKYMESFGYKEEWGSYSDIADIGPAWDVASVNVSVGYYDQHTQTERLHVDELEMTIGRVLLMIQNPIKKLYTPIEDYSFGYCDSYFSPMKHVKKAKGAKMCEFCSAPLKEGKSYKYQGSIICDDCKEWVDINKQWREI